MGIRGASLFSVRLPAAAGSGGSQVLPLLLQRPQPCALQPGPLVQLVQLQPQLQGVPGDLSTRRPSLPHRPLVLPVQLQGLLGQLFEPGREALGQRKRGEEGTETVLASRGAAAGGRAGQLPRTGDGQQRRRKRKQEGPIGEGAEEGPPSGAGLQLPPPPDRPPAGTIALQAIRLRG